jgi:hypothetical protein
MSFGKIKLDKNDILFSKMIRERDGKCVFCGKIAMQSKLECSHFWGRGDKHNRFNPDNCDTLCWYDHMQNEGNKQGKYRDFKIKQLGKKVYNEMERKHYQETKKYGEFEKEKLHQILKEQYKNKEHLKKGWQVIW